uniref:Reverse transcriptase domain-containing protein n=1 Tax=Tanacetum cinerariifolium TaxID=118510 RepID=A0A699GM32_TANCI|nr:hypothetical protein [Tanacetum cinerariifolium]
MESTTSISLPKPPHDKGKAKMSEPEKPLKKKYHIREVAQKLQAQLEAKLEEEEEEEKLARQREEDANVAKWDDAFDKTMSWIDSFVPIDFKVVKHRVKRSETRIEGSSKRAREELESKNLKKQKLDENVEAEVNDDQEKAEMKKHMEIILDDKNIDREDLETLWKLVKAKNGLTRPEKAYERVLWGDLEVMFEPDIESKGRISNIDANEDIYLVNVHRDIDMCGVNDLDGDEVVVKNVDASTGKKVEQSEKVVETDVASKDVNLIVDEVILAQALTALKSKKPKTDKVVIQEPKQGTTTATTITPTSTRPRSKGIVFHDQEQAPTPTPIVHSQQSSQVKDKGKGIMRKGENNLQLKEQRKRGTDHKQKLNINIPDIEAHDPYSIVDKPSTSLIYVNNKLEKRVMYLAKIVNYCDATLKRVLKEVNLKIFKSEPWRKRPLLGTRVVNLAYYLLDGGINGPQLLPWRDHRIYHSFILIKPFVPNNGNKISKLRGRPKGVENHAKSVKIKVQSPGFASVKASALLKWLRNSKILRKGRTRRKSSPMINNGKRSNEGISDSVVANRKVVKDDSYCLINENDGLFIKKPLVSFDDVINDNSSCVKNKGGVVNCFVDLVSNGASKLNMDDVEHIKVESTWKANKDAFLMEDIKKGSKACALQLYGYFVGTSMDYRVVNENLSGCGEFMVLLISPRLLVFFTLSIKVKRLNIVKPSTIPIWVCVYGIPFELYNGNGIGKKFSGIGKLMLMDKLTKERYLKKSGKLDFARVLAEVSAKDELPHYLEIDYPQIVRLGTEAEITANENRDALRSKVNNGSDKGDQDMIDKEDDFLQGVDEEYINLDYFYKNCSMFGMEPYVDDEEVESENECMGDMMKPEIIKNGRFESVKIRTVQNEYVWSKDVDGFSMFSVVSKHKALKKPLRKLKFSQCNLAAIVNRLKEELCRVQTVMVNDPTNVSIRKEEASLIKQFNNAVKDEYLFLKQRIDVVEDMEGNLFYGNVVGEQFVKHFQEVLGRKEVFGRKVMVDPICEPFNLFLNKLSNLDVKFMVRYVSNEEMKSFLFSIDDDKARGLDEFSFKFFKASWKISDTIMLTQELMRNYHRNSGPSNVAFKIDINKAYDSVD